MHRSKDRAGFLSLQLTAAALILSLTSVFSFILKLVTSLASFIASGVADECKVSASSQKKVL